MQRITMGTIMAIALVGIVVSVLGTLVSTHIISNTVNVKTVNVRVYWDIECTDAVYSIDWGDLEAGGTTDVTIYVKNEGSFAMKLNMDVDNWNPPSTSTNATVTWNHENHVLNAGEVVQAVLTLSFSPSISGISSSSFDITITGTEQT